MEISEMTPYINELEKDYEGINETLVLENPSLAQNLSVYLTKMLILSCASMYEQCIKNAYLDYAEEQSKLYGKRPHCFDDEKRNSSVYSKFDFGKVNTPEDVSQLPNVKKMLLPLKCFGVKFCEMIYEEIDADSQMIDQLCAFQEVFAMRNLIAHQTFIEFSNLAIRNKTFGDLIKLHNKASKFVEYLVKKFV